MVFPILIVAILGFILGAIVVCIILSKSIKKYKQQSLTDELTGLYNSREFKNRLIQETERSKRYKLPFSLLLIDVDKFKDINDNFGYKAADKVLCDLVSKIQNQLRASDLFFRYKLGDEFVIIALNTNIEGAKVLAERINKSLSKEPFLIGKQQIEVRITIGFSDFEIDKPEKRIEQEAIEDLRRLKQNKYRLI